jgi:hypothetical protein
MFSSGFEIFSIPVFLEEGRRARQEYFTTAVNSMLPPKETLSNEQCCHR